MLVVDTTSDMSAYIDEIRNRIDAICRDITTSTHCAVDDIRVGFAAFQTHSPTDQRDQQGRGLVTEAHEFTDVATFKANIAVLKGDDVSKTHPETQYDVLHAKWRDDATKVVVFMTGSPLRGVDDYQDKISGEISNREHCMATLRN